MAIDNFKFSSPGVFINEIDESTLPAQPDLAGPVIIGKARKGPALIPTKVRSTDEFVQMFGEPIYGSENREDVWREGNLITPSYASLAAYTSLKNGVPVTFVRTLGVDGVEDGTAKSAGWGFLSSSADIGTLKTSVSDNNAAYALVLMPYSGSVALNVTGSVAAIIYAKNAALALSGAYVTGSLSAEKASALIKADSGTNAESTFTLVVSSSSGRTPIKVNFSRNNADFIRTKLNTNPTVGSYFLGESFEDFLTESHAQLSVSSSWAATIIPLQSGSSTTAFIGHSHKYAAASASTDWVFANWDGVASSFAIGSVQNLFKFHSLTEGEWNQNNLKICIEDIQESSNTTYKYGKFNVVVRNLFTGVAQENFAGVSLDPDSENFISKIIGDISYSWNDEKGALVATGDYANKSKYIRVEVSDGVKNKDVDPSLLPFGYKLPPKYAKVEGVTKDVISTTSVFAAANSSYILSDATGISGLSGSSGFATASIAFPSLPVVSSGKGGTTWGLKDSYTSTSSGSTLYNRSVVELLRKLPVNSSALTTQSEYFTLNDLSGTLASNTTTLSWSQGSHGSNTSTLATGAASLTTFLKYHNKFSLPLYGGFDGLDITEKQPISDDNISGTDEDNNYVLKTVNRALNLVSDREVVPCNAILVPGISKPVVTNKMIDICTTRGDAIALIDLADSYVPANEGTATSKSVDTVISELKSRDINNSFAATFYPWVKIKNPKTQSVVTIPATVAGIAAISKSEKIAGNVWFAPAGFTRGKLDGDQNLGLNVSGVVSRLSQKERDKLYEANINPIATLPEGIILFGQKTLQVTPSALDRINVRRLLNYIKTEVSMMAATTLFEPNVEGTWKNFTDRADPFLTSIVSGQGLAEYKLVLDSTTTTPDLVDRNIIYGKVYLKPVRAAEFFALDFTIVRSNANLTD